MPVLLIADTRGDTVVAIVGGVGVLPSLIDDEPPVPIRRVNDLETLLDRLALVEPRKEAGPGTAVAATEPTKAKRNVLTFAPDGARGVAAYVDGEKTATA